jgi:toxin ParE1/3/4
MKFGFILLKNWSADQANCYSKRISEEINNICKKPDSGKSMALVRKGYRVSNIKSHLIFY